MGSMQARAVIGSFVLVLTSLLAACNEESQAPEAGDVIQARADNQFEDGRESDVALPTGRLLIRSAEPVDSATADETRIREAVDAPAGTVLVPISWQYDPWSSDRLDGIFATNQTPIVELVTNGEQYRLRPPDPAAEAGESFYVVVDGNAEERSLEIEFDGVTQSIDLETGSRDEDRAAPLYDIEDEKLRKKPCDEADWFDTRTVNAEFVCDLVGPVLTPYAAGEWAPEGSMWLALTVSTELGVYAETDLFGSGARYAGREVKLKAEIDGEEPAYRLSTEDESDQCPSGFGCNAAAHVVFEVPEDDVEQGPLVIELTYKLTMLNSWGTWDGRERLTVTADEKLKLWETENKKKKKKAED